MQPSSLSEAIAYFSDPDVATEYVARLRWPDGFVCPHCGGRDHSYLSTRRLWKCKSCKKQSSVKVGTIFEGSPLGLDKWLPAIWAAANAQLSPHELARVLGVTEKSAWFMLQRIGEAKPAPVAEVGEPSRAGHPSALPALVLAVFAFGVLVGRLTKRVG